MQKYGVADKTIDLEYEELKEKWEQIVKQLSVINSELSKQKDRPFIRNIELFHFQSSKIFFFKKKKIRCKIYHGIGR